MIFPDSTVWLKNTEPGLHLQDGSVFLTLMNTVTENSFYFLEYSLVYVISTVLILAINKFMENKHNLDFITSGYLQYN